jgi:putative transposase
MARRPRLQFPGAAYHVMSRGNRKSTIFATDDDRRRFMNVLGETARTYHVRVYAVCLMGTHYHLVLDAPRGNLSAMMRQLNGVYSQDSNRSYALTGHTFEARFHSIVVQRERYLRRVARYVVLNPVKAQLCADAASWPWTTYRATAGLEPAPAWLYTEWILWAFKTQSRSDAEERYRQYVNNDTAERDHCETRDIAGSEGFRRKVIAFQQLDDKPLPRDWQAVVRPRLEDVFGERGHSSCRDRAVRTAREEHGYSLSEIAIFLGVHRTTVSKALRRVRRALTR